MILASQITGSVALIGGIVYVVRQDLEIMQATSDMITSVKEFAQDILRTYVFPLVITVNSKLSVDRTEVRQAIIQTAPPFPVQKDSIAPHPEGARTRYHALTIMEKYFKDSGRVPLIHQPSKRDPAMFPYAKFDAIPHWGLDYTAPITSSDTDTATCDVFVDVVYYLNIHNYASGKPLIVYGFQPTCVARENQEYAYNFCCDNTVEYKVSGDVFRHPVWNFGGTHVMLRNYANVAFYSVESVHLTNDHSIVFLIPEWHGGFAASALSHLLPDKPLGFFTPFVKTSQGGFYRMQVAGKADVGHVVHTSVDYSGRSSFSVASCSLEIDGRVADHVKVYSKSMHPSELTSTTGLSSSANKILHMYHKASTGCPCYTSAVMAGVNHYQMGDEWDPEAKPSGQELLKCAQTFVPMKSAGNLQVAVAERIKKGVENSIKQPVPEVISNFLIEFVDILSDVLGKLVPFPLSEIRSKLRLAKQVKEFDEIEDWELTPEMKLSIAVFEKAESYDDVKIPRPIVPFQSNFKFMYSRYTLALAEAVSVLPWYAFHRSPLSVAQRLAAIGESSARDGIDLLETDFSRFDGSISNLRPYESILLQKLFPDDSRELLILWNLQFGAKYAGKFSYVTEGERCSGSPETSVLNTIDNAMFNYAAFRNSGSSKTEAWNSLGLYGGDDGVTPTNKPDEWPKLAVLLGMNIKPKIVRKGQMVSFLGRMFGGVWSGSPNSCCDLQRTVRNLCYSHDRITDPGVKLQQKIGSLCITDSKTPMFKTLFATHEDETLYDEDNYTSKWVLDYDESEGFPNHLCDWMLSYCARVSADGDWKTIIQGLPESTYKALVNGVQYGNVDPCKNVKNRTADPKSAGSRGRKPAPLKTKVLRSDAPHVQVPAAPKAKIRISRPTVPTSVGDPPIHGGQSN